MLPKLSMWYFPPNAHKIDTEYMTTNVNNNNINKKGRKNASHSCSLRPDTPLNSGQFLLSCVFIPNLVQV